MFQDSAEILIQTIMNQQYSMEYGLGKLVPDAVSAAPNPTVIMAAEKIADQIKKTL